MNEFINRHSIKIQVGVLLSFLVFVITTAMYVGGFVHQVEANAQTLKAFGMQIGKIPVLENNVDIIKDDLKEIKTDIKSLLSR